MSRREWADAVRQRFALTRADLVGFRFAINVGLGTVIVWQALDVLGHRHPIWAIASMIAASEPEPGEARRIFRSRLVNAAVGSAAGLVFLVAGGMASWVMPVALATTVLVSSYLVRVKTMWRQAPITAAIVIASGVAYQSTSFGITQGLLKVAEVTFGCLVGLAVSLVMSRVWLIQEFPEERHRQTLLADREARQRE
jgi:uncharacterized membrane protein YccC